MILIDKAQYKNRKFSLGIDLHVKPQSFSAVLGASGAGKSTLLSIIAGFEKLNAGKLWLDGADMQVFPQQIGRRHRYRDQIPPVDSDARPPLRGVFGGAFFYPFPEPDFP